MSKSIKRNAVYNIIYKVLNVIFPLISTAYVSRILLADGIGRVSSVSNNVSYFLIFASLGIPVLGLREIAKYRDNQEKKDKVFSELFIINFLLTFFAYIVFHAVIQNFDYFKEDVILYEIFGISILLNIFNIDWLFQGMEEYGYIATRSSVIKFVSMIALFFFVRTREDIYVYAGIQVLATTGNYVLNVIRARKYINFSLKNIKLKKYTKPLIYLALCSISTELYARIDITMLSIMKSEDIVGYYVNSQKIINLTVTTLVAMTAVLMPRLSYLFHQDKKKFNSLINNGLKIMITISVPLFVGIILVSDPLVSILLGNDFNPAKPIIIILSAMIPLKCIGDIICYQVMMCAEKESILMRSYFVTLMINLILNFILIPQYGANGAAISSVISEVAVFIVVFYYSRKYFVLDNQKILVGKTFLSTFIMAIAVFLVSTLISSQLLKLAVGISIGVLFYGGFCLVLRQSVVLKAFWIAKNRIDRALKRQKK